MTNMEQSSFEFEPEKQEIESQSNEELVVLYQEKVGKNPTYRTLSREQMIEGIKNPEEEKMRLAEEDRASDQEEISKTYRR